jgi:hypothetical protein
VFLRCLITFFLTSPAVLADPNPETAHSTQKAIANTTTQPLPRCINSPEEIAQIKASIKANGKTDYKYKAYRQALQNESEAELLARLVYAETLAANCSDLNNKIAPLIRATINNRIQKRKGDIRGVIFQRDQFASSLNIYSQSKYLEFLCPKDQILWNLILKPVPSPLSLDTVNYFLYKHSPRWTSEPWTLPEDAGPNNSELRKCIRFFRNPNWK